jgi:seryl-tRNA synthetase
MLEAKWVLENTEQAKALCLKRSKDLSLLEQFISLSLERKSLLKIVEDSRAQLNALAKEVGQLKSKGADATSLMDEVAQIKKNMADKEAVLKEVESKFEDTALRIPNFVHDSVPVGTSEEDNAVVSQWGEVPVFNFAVKDHADLGEQLGMMDFETAALMTGSRFVLLKGDLAKLERALAHFMLNYHGTKGYTEVSTPFMANEKALIGTGNLPKFKEDLFKLEGQEWYLIPTSEVTLTNMVREKVLTEAELPLKYTALTPCFRSEAGSYGRDTKGLIRMHQFQKVEMVQITSQEKSWEAHEEMVASGKALLEALGLPYRVLLLCSGDMGFSSTKTFDLEVWVPSQNKYREISSISNCGDFQARRASIRYKGPDGKMKFAHTLNGSGLAVGRTLVAVLENYQQADGSILIPKALQPYMGGQTVIKRT